MFRGLSKGHRTHTDVPSICDVEFSLGGGTFRGKCLKGSWVRAEDNGKAAEKNSSPFLGLECVGELRQAIYHQQVFS